jgi:hypothetical protein
MVNLSDQVTQMSINSGALIVKLRNLWDGESWEVDTPNGAVTLLRTGEYRIDTDPNRNATMVTVRSGDAEVTSNNQSFPVHARQTAYLECRGYESSGRFRSVRVFPRPPGRRAASPLRVAVRHRL